MCRLYQHTRTLSIGTAGLSISLPAEKQKDKVRDGDSKSVIGLMALTWAGTVHSSPLPGLIHCSHPSLLCGLGHDRLPGLESHWEKKQIVYGACLRRPLSLSVHFCSESTLRLTGKVPIQPSILVTWSQQGND